MASTLIDRLDGLSSSAAIKGPCLVATTANIVLSGLQTIDGVLMPPGGRVLVKDQTDARENGVYRVDTGPWRRTSDFKQTRDVVEGTLIPVVGGAENVGSIWAVDADDPVSVGSDEINFKSLFVTIGTLPLISSLLKGQLLAVKRDGTGFELTGSASGHMFAENGSRIVRIQDRLFVAGATLHTGTNDLVQPDWSTQALQELGYTAGFMHFSQVGILTNPDVLAANALFTAARSSTLGTDGNATGHTSLAYNDYAGNRGAWAGYDLAIRKNAAVLGPTYGREGDIVNLGDEVEIDPFQQALGQTVAFQYASGGEFDANAASAWGNIQANGAQFLKGLVFGWNSLKAKLDGIAQALILAPNQAIDWYSAAGQRSWRIFAESGLNGKFFIRSAGSGAVSFDRIEEVTGDAWPAYTPTVSRVSGGTTGLTVSSKVGGSRKLGKLRFFSVQATISADTVTNGTAENGIVISLPEQAANVSGLGYSISADIRGSVGRSCRAAISPNGTSVEVYIGNDNSYPGGAGSIICVSGFYQTA